MDSPSFWMGCVLWVFTFIALVVTTRQKVRYRTAWLNQCRQTERDAGVRREMMAELEEVDKERRNAIDLSAARYAQIEELRSRLALWERPLAK